MAQRGGPRERYALASSIRIAGSGGAMPKPTTPRRHARSRPTRASPLRGASVLVAHHNAGWARADRAGAPRADIGGRGVTALDDGQRWRVTLTSEPVETDDPELREIVTFTPGKTNYSRKGEPSAPRAGCSCPSTRPKSPSWSRRGRRQVPPPARRSGPRSARQSSPETRSKTSGTMRACGRSSRGATRAGLDRVCTELRCGPPRAERAIARVRAADAPEVES